jgi:signal transduction histidine kinase
LKNSGEIYFMRIRLNSWHWLDSLFLLFRFIWVTTNIIYITHYPEQFITPYWLTVIWVLISFSIPLLIWRVPNIPTKYYVLAEVILSGGFSICFCLWNVHTIPYLSIPSIFAGYLTRKRLMLWSASIFIILLPVTQALIISKSITDTILDVTNNAILFIIGNIIQYIYLSRQRMNQLLEDNKMQMSIITEQNNTLKIYSEQIAKTTIIEERNRLSHELHDTVGHTLTSVIMGMDAISHLIDVSPQTAKGKLEKLRDVTQTGLEEVRNHIHSIAKDEDYALLPTHLIQIALDFETHTNTRISVKVEGTEFEIPRSFQHILIRCTQESLTNATRHGKATFIEIVLSFHSKRVALTIKDNGMGVENIQFGFGLSKMSERAEAMNGSLQVISQLHKGTTVKCTIPRGKVYEENKTFNYR